MAVNNTNPTTSVSENYSKYAEYFEQDKDKSVLSIETFFTLLMAEMSNQDPLEPTSNTEFISQLANFTALQNSSNTLYYNTVSYAASLAGKVVTVATTKPGSDGKLEIQTGVVTGVDISDGTNIEITVNGKRYLLSNVMNVADNAGTYTSGSDGAYAVSLIGKKVTLFADTGDGKVLDQGIVESIEIEDGEYRVVVNGYSFALSDIIKVNNADEEIVVGKGESTEKSTDESTANSSFTGDGAFAVSLIGKNVSVLTQQGYSINGIVESISLKGGLHVVINGISYPLANVTSVNGEFVTPSTGTEDGEENTDPDEDETTNTETSIITEENED